MLNYEGRSKSLTKSSKNCVLDELLNLLYFKVSCTIIIILAAYLPPVLTL